jgi:putative RecB family exonuclease
MPTFSHSRIGTFEQCHLKYKYGYIDNLKTEKEKGVEAFMGSRVHEALEKLYKDMLFEKFMSLQEVLDYFNKLWKENWNDSVKINKKEYTQENYRKMGERCLTDFYNRYKPFNQGRVIGIETQEQMKLDDKYKFHIRIDRLMDMGNGVYEVHDYKAGGKLPTKEELDSDRQLAAYSLWVLRNFDDVKKIRLIWHFVLFDKEMESSRTPKQLDDLRKQIIEKIKQIEKTKVFKPTKSALCDWCEYQHLCPLWKHEIELEEKEANEFLKDSGVKLVNEYVKINSEKKEFDEKCDKQLEKLKEALIEFCKKEKIEVVVGSDNKISVKETESLKFPGKNTPEREKLIEVLKKMKKLDEVTDLDIYALAKIVKEEAWDKSKLAKIAKFETVENSYRFSLSKRKDEE